MAAFSSIAAALTTASSTASGLLSASSIAGVAAGAGLVASGVGLYQNIQGQRELSAASKRAEAARERQAELNSLRERRQIIRRAQAARAVALSNATASGAEESSALFGAFGQIGSEAARSTRASNENLELGREVFAANRDVASAKSTIATGAGLSSFGSDAVNASPRIGAIGSTLFGGRS
jgi:uncharacterized protein HemX